LRTTTPSRRRSRRRSGLQLSGLAVLAVLLTSGCDAREAYENSFSLGFPDPVTEEGDKIYDLWLGSMAAAGAVGLFVLLLILYAVVRFRKRGDDLPRQVRYNLPVEVLYTVLPMIIVAVLFYYTAVGQNYVNEESENPDVTVQVIGFQWNWTFQYDDGDGNDDNDVEITGEPTRPARLVIPVNQTVRFDLASNDVIHSFWVPKFLFKRDVIPGRSNSFEITPHTEGTYIGRCAELCGEKHDRMNFEVEVVSQQKFADYLRDEKAKLSGGSTSASGVPTTTTSGSTS
jgi:cytochrome c oxidase subunit 2